MVAGGSWIDAMMAEAVQLAGILATQQAEADPQAGLTREQRAEWKCCSEDAAYFINTYVSIYDAVAGEWVPFKLWPEQVTTLDTIGCNLLTAILKARQLGLTWLCLGYALWLLLFRPIATVLLFSRRDDEAVHLLDVRLKGMYKSLPAWMHSVQHVSADNTHRLEFSTGSVALAFPTSAGDSYTATFALVDEADLVPDLNRLMRAVKPTIDNGGQMVLLSRSDKSRPNSEFKNIYRASRRGDSPWASVFLPWNVHPKRDAAWYAAQKADIESRTGSLDDLWEQYPATDTEALAPRVLDKRLHPTWLEGCFDERKPLPDEELPSATPAVPTLQIWALPELGGSYVIGADPAEGNPQSDDSAFDVINAATGEQVAMVCGKIEPQVFGDYIDQLGRFYNQASVLVERNNHGHTVIAWLKDHSGLALLLGPDRREGWRTTQVSKIELYDHAAEIYRNGEAAIHSFKTLTQLQGIEASTLSAPEGDHDDCAMANVLAHKGRLLARGQLQWASSPIYGWRG